MKKIPVIIVSLLFLVATMFSSCGMNSTKLTESNYKDYLKVKVSAQAAKNNDTYWAEEINGETIAVKRYMKLSCTVQGTSKNFNYNDVKLGLKITIKCKCFNESSNEIIDKVIEETIDMYTDIAGNRIEPFKKEYTFDGYGFNDEYIDVNVELINIEGNVTPVK